jgi:hypothetical protein
MTDLDKLFDQIRQLPPDRLKLVVNYAEYVVTGRSRKDRQNESDATLEKDLEAILKANSARRTAAAS